MASILVATLPILTILLTGSRRKEEIIFSLLGFLGIVIVNFNLFEDQRLLGSFLILASSLVSAFATVMAKKRSFPSLWTNLCIQLLISSVVLFLLSYLTNEVVSLKKLQLQTWAAILYLAVFGAILGMGAYLYLVKNANALLVTSHAYVNPIIALIIGTLFRNESYSKVEWIGVTLVIISVLLINTYDLLRKLYLNRSKI